MTVTDFAKEFTANEPSKPLFTPSNDTNTLSDASNALI